MIRDDIIGYQYAERIKSELIIGSKMIMVVETLRDSELEGAKKTLFAFLDALSAEANIASGVTGVQEFMLVEGKLKDIKIIIEEGYYREAYANIGSAISYATTVCSRTMSSLMENGLM